MLLAAPLLGVAVEGAAACPVGQGEPIL